jgi:hypothetical protein
MKKTGLFFLATASILLMTTLTSCNKETSGKVTFWYGADISALAEIGQVSAFTYYLNGEIIGSSASNIYSTAQPTCGQGGAVSADVDLDKEDSANLSYKVVDEDGDVWIEGTVKVENDGCSIIQITI